MYLLCDQLELFELWTENLNGGFDKRWVGQAAVFCLKFGILRFLGAITCQQDGKTENPGASLSCLVITFNIVEGSTRLRLIAADINKSRLYMVPSRIHLIGKFWESDLWSTILDIFIFGTLPPISNSSVESRPRYINFNLTTMGGAIN